MADALYNKAKESFLSQNPSIDLDTDLIKMVPVNTGTDYTFSAAHQYLTDITAYSGATAQTLSNKTVTDGVFDNTADITFTALAIDGAKTVDAFVIYYDTTVAATSPLIAYWDTFSAITPNGTDVVVTPNVSGLFAL